MWLISLISLIILLLILFSDQIRCFYNILKFPGPSVLTTINHIFDLRLSHPFDFNLVVIKFPHTLPIFRVWLGWYPTIIITDPKYVKTVLTHPNLLDKSHLVKKCAKPVVGESILISPLEKWYNNRKIVARGFNNNYIVGFLPEFIRQTDILIQQLRENLSGNFDIHSLFEKTSMDIALNAVMGVDLSSQKKDSNYFKTLLRLIHLANDRITSLDKQIDFIYNRTQAKKELDTLKDVIWRWTDDVIKHRREISKDLEIERTFLDVLLQTTETNEEFTDEDVRNEANLLILAAFDTLAISLSWIILMLALHPEIQEKAYEEVRSILDTSKPSMTDLVNLEYLEMVIKETLRYFPVSPFYFRNAIEDTQLGDYTVPKGTTCLISVYHVHHNEIYWPKSKVFDPERFRNDIHPFAFIPFSAGPRNCVGMKYAMLCLKVVISKLLLNYKFETDLKLDQLKLICTTFLTLDGGYQVRISEREK